MTLLLIGLGALCAGPFLYLVHHLRGLAVSLVIVAVVYVAFALLFRATGPWFVAELGGVALFGLFAWLGLRYGYIWLALGWALHVLWDVVLHRWWLQPGFVPDVYPALCLGFDLVVAGYCVWRLFLSDRQRRCLTI